MDNEKIKPNYFNFGNEQIKEKLEPLYIQAPTWKRFFRLIELRYPKDKCTLMYPWIDKAMGYIFKQMGGNDLYTGKDWKIMLSSVPHIKYYEVQKSLVGGSDIIDRKYEQQYDNYRSIDNNNVERWDINSFLKRSEKRNTHKNNKHKKTLKLRKSQKTYKNITIA